MKKLVTLLLSIIMVLVMTIPSMAISSINVKSITLNNKLLIMKVGQAGYLRVSFSPSNTTQKALTYVTDNKKVATVSSTGKIIGMSAGKTTITVYTFDKSVFAKCNVTVIYEELKPVEIEWLGFDSQGVPAKDAEIVKIVEKKYNAKFNIWSVDASKWDDVLNVKMASGNIPDVIYMRNRNNISKYASMGIIGELPIERIRSSAPNYAATVDAYDTEKVMWKICNVNGKNYGFATIRLAGTYPSALIWRTDWLKNVGITKVPATISEFEKAIYAFRNDDPDKNGKKDTYGFSNRSLSAIYGAFGISAGETEGGTLVCDTVKMLKSGKIVYSAIQPEMKPALTLLQKWYKDGVIDPEFITGENKGGYKYTSTAFVNSRIGVTLATSFYHYTPGGAASSDLLKVNPSATIDFAAPIAGTDGKSGVPWNGYIGGAQAFSTNCLKDERKVETLLKMLDDLYSDESYADMCMYGLPNVDYVPTTKNGKAYFAPLPGVPAYTVAVSRQKGINVFDYFGNPDIAKKMEWERYDYAKTYITDKNVKGYFNPPVPPTDEEAKYGETLRRLVEESYIKIITGEKSVDYFTEFVDTFKKNGGNETEAAMTVAYNKLFGSK